MLISSIKMKYIAFLLALCFYEISLLVCFTFLKASTTCSILWSCVFVFLFAKLVLYGLWCPLSVEATCWNPFAYRSHRFLMKFTKKVMHVQKMYPNVPYSMFVTRRRNLVLYNHPICYYVRQNVICNYVLSFLQLFTIYFNLLKN